MGCPEPGDAGKEEEGQDGGAAGRRIEGQGGASEGDGAWEPRAFLIIFLGRGPFKSGRTRRPRSAEVWRARGSAGR